MTLAACVNVLKRAKSPLVGSFPRHLLKSQLLFYSNGTVSTASSAKIESLLAKLVEQPLSRIKASLDTEDQSLSSTFKNQEFSWVALITALRSSSIQKANVVAEWRLDTLITQKESNQHCYSELIYAMGNCQNVDAALRIFSVMEAHGLKPQTSVLNALISACLSSNNVATALSLFELMEISEDFRCDSDTYNTFINGYANMRNKKAMETWYLAKTAAGFGNGVQTFEYLILGCVKSKCFDDAERYYEEMTLAGHVPTSSIMQNMLLVFCEQRNVTKVRDHIKFGLNGSFNINRHIAKVVVDLYYENRQVDYMEELLDALKKSNQATEVLALVHYTIIRTYVKAERLEDVEHAVGRMLGEGISFRHPDDVDKVVCLHFRKAAFDKLDLFLNSIKNSYKLTKSTYDLLIAGYRRARAQEKVDSVMMAMKLNGFTVP